MKLVGLISCKLAFGEAVGVVEFEDKMSICSAIDGNDEGLLHGSVHFAAIHKAARVIVNLDTHVAEALVEMDVDGVVTGTG